MNCVTHHSRGFIPISNAKNVDMKKNILKNCKYNDKISLVNEGDQKQMHAGLRLVSTKVRKKHFFSSDLISTTRNELFPNTHFNARVVSKNICKSANKRVVSI